MAKGELSLSHTHTPSIFVHVAYVCVHASVKQPRAQQLFSRRSEQCMYVVYCQRRLGFDVTENKFLMRTHVNKKEGWKKDF